MARERRDRIVEALFQVRPSEIRLTTLLLAYCTCAVGAFIVGRSVRDALFLAHVGREKLPLMYVLSAVSVAVVGVVYARVADRARRDRLNAATAAILAAVCVAAWGGTLLAEDWVYSVLYVFVEVMGALAVIQFWTLANDLFHSRDAKRLFGTIGSGGTIANIVLGLAVGGLARHVGTENLLFLMAALLAACSMLARALGRHLPARVVARSAVRRGPRPMGAAARVARTPYLRTLAILTAVTFLATTLVDFQFKVASAAAFSKDALAAFFGTFYAATGGAALLVQLVGTSRLLGRFGVVVGLMILPVSLGFGAASLLVWPGLIAATATRGADFVFRYTLNDATTQLLYVPVAANARAGAKAFVDGVVKPASIALAGLLIAVYRARFEVRTGPLAATTLAMCIVWATLLLSLRSHYVQSLQETLRRRGLDLDAARSRIAEGATARVLVRALKSSDAEEVLNALAILPQVPQLDVDEQVEHLLASPRADVRVAALQHLGGRGSLRYGNAVYRLFDDPDASVRAAAISAFSAIGREKAVRSVRAYLRDPAPAIRGAAVVGMIRYGGLDGVLAAAEALKDLVGHDDALMRQHAAHVLGAIGVRNFYQPVLELMADHDVAVRRAAIQAAGQLKAPELSPALVYRLAREETAREAAAALVAFGPGVEPLLGRVLDNRAEDPSIRRNVPRILGRLATGPAVAVLTRHLQDPDEDLRRRVYRALARALRVRQDRAVDRKAVLAALDNELLRAYAALAAGHLLALRPLPAPGAPRDGASGAEGLLAAALADKVALAEERVFILLGILYPDAGLETAFAGFKDASGAEAKRRRGTTVELIDNVAGADLRRKLMPLLDDGPVPARLRAAEPFFSMASTPQEGHLKALLTDEAAWVQSCAAWFAAQRRDVELAQEVAKLLDHGWEVARETALVALSHLAAPQDFADRARARAQDESALVRARAADLLGASSAKPPAEG